MAIAMHILWSVFAGEVEENGLKVEGEEGVVWVSMLVQQFLHQDR